VVYRSDAISETTPADDAKLANLDIKIVCDFRGESEIEEDGADKLPPGAQLVSLPVFDPSNDVAADLRTAITSGDQAAVDALVANGKGEQILIDGNRSFVRDANAREQFAAVVERIADPAALPAFTHCTGGKDRTGWSTAVLLTALGVPKKTVMADYLLTNDLIQGINADRRAAIQELGIDTDVLEPILEVQPEYLQAGFDAVKRKYGSFSAYLRKGLGIDDATLEQLEQNLLTD
jgi:protein-tyrosine phosphatase